MKIFRYIFAIFQALVTLAFGVFLATLFYFQAQSPINIILPTLILGIAIYFSVSVFYVISKRGIITAMTGDNATYDLDLLEPIPGDGVLKLTPKKLEELFNNEELTFRNNTTISIWGDWEGRKLNSKHIINSISFDGNTKILNIEFDENYKLAITEPRLILTSISYIKIANAKSVVWQTPTKFNSLNKYVYKHTGKEIITQSNTNWQAHNYDIGIGMNAVYLQA